MPLHNGIKHGVVVNLVGSRFYHYHLFLAGSNSKLQVRLCSLLRIRHKHDFAVHKAHGNPSYRTIPRNIGDGNGDRSAYHGNNFGLGIGIDGKNGHND